MFQLKLQIILNILIDWWLIESHLSGCYCQFVKKIGEGGRDLCMPFN